MLVVCREAEPGSSGRPGQRLPEPPEPETSVRVSTNLRSKMAAACDMSVTSEPGQ